MQNMWQQLMQELAVEPQKAQLALASITHAYSDPQRVYHTLDHIQAMLEWIERLRTDVVDFSSLQLAVWLHDSVYDTHATDNEEQSVLYAQHMLSDLALPADCIQAVVRMIMCTKTHSVSDDNRDARILCDADVAIFGASVQRYDMYAQAIRQEYAWVPDVTYRTARVQILQTFLQRDRIYFTEFFYRILEKPARENIRREITSLL